MSKLSSYLYYRQLLRTQWLSHEGLRQLQDKKLRRLVMHAYQTVPFYREHFDNAKVKPEDIQKRDDLSRIPIITKADLQSAGQDNIISSIYNRDQLKQEHTSGSTGRPFTVSFDPAFLRVRNGLFLRTLTTAGYRIGNKMMLITDASHKKKSNRLIRWRYVSIADPVEKMLSELNDFKPDVLYGCMTPLRQMAQVIRKTGLNIHKPRVVIPTAEVLDSDTRQLFKEVYQAEIFDNYGLTEMGMVAWECPHHNGYHLSEDTVIIDFVRDSQSDVDSMVMTNLELYGMPLIRFQTGDFAAKYIGESCACGRSLQRIERIEGRVLDSVKLADGRVISPYRFTLAIEKISNIGRYQLIQESYDRFLLLIEGDNRVDSELTEIACQTISTIVGRESHIKVCNKASLDPEPGLKFRVVESRVA